MKHNKQKSQCRRGHKFTTENTIVDKRGHRARRICKRMRSISRSLHPGIGTGGVFKSRMACAYGHPYSPSNTTSYGQGRRCKTCDSRRTAEHKYRLKMKIISAYGGKCSYLGCNISDPDMLTIDHVYDNGAAERQGRTMSGDRIYRIIKSKGFPKEYQLLCANHNLKKEILRKRKLRESKSINS